ncbi:hypothetical protein ABZ413_29560 [Nocardia rhamnosiphila]|uniref:hypothetical protein n=1 Tax=Nocardia rhamnosiphila TaxID=426716 RepID=UPI003410D198
MGVYVKAELFGVDDSYWCLSGQGAGEQGAILALNPLGIYDAPVKVGMKRGAFEIGGKPSKIDRPYREIQLMLTAVGDTAEEWADVDSRLRMAFDYETDPWDPEGQQARLQFTTPRGIRWLDVLLLESPIMALDTDPWDYGISNLPVTLVAGQPMYRENDWVGDAEHPAGWQLEGASSGAGTVWVCNPTDRPMNQEWIVTGNGVAVLPDFSWTGPKGARVPGVDFRTDRDDSDRVLYTPPIGTENGSGARFFVDRGKLPAVDNLNTNLSALMDGNRLLYQIPPYTPWTELPVSAEDVTSDVFGILCRQPRFWSRPWGLERF